MILPSKFTNQNCHIIAKQGKKVPQPVNVSFFQDDDGDEKESLAFKVLSSEQTNELMSLDVVQIQE